MTRQTSIEAYRQIVSEGLLSKRKLEVYQILFKYGPLTAHEIVDVARSKYPKANQTGFNARVSELSDLGCVADVGIKIHPVSNKKNTLWDVTRGLPVERSKREKILSQIARLERSLVRLRSQLRELDS